ncbi:MAG: type II toxin-antitoxin system Phd/YefM family antitoxin [bacterium]|nr:type II toxin-antitoxin system Phd/YefM family antitoxin [bacterium]
MITLHPEYLLKKGKKEFVILPYEEFSSLKDLLEDMDDLLDLRKAKKREMHKPVVLLKDLKQKLAD